MSIHIACLSQELIDSSKTENDFNLELFGGISYTPFYFERNFYLFNIVLKTTNENSALRSGLGFEIPQKEKNGYFDISFGGESFILSKGKINTSFGLITNLGYAEYDGKDVLDYYRDITIGLSPLLGTKFSISQNFIFSLEACPSFSYKNKKFIGHSKFPGLQSIETEKIFFISTYKLFSLYIGYRF